MHYSRPIFFIALVIATAIHAEDTPPSPVSATPFSTAHPAPTPAAAAALPKKIPFGYASKPDAASEIPSAPHKAQAVPVGDVDAIEASEPAPPTPVAPEADPAQEDPAAPTALTSPIFSAESSTVPPQKIILRALNKVTAQSELLSLKPNEPIKFGQLEIKAVTCRTSSPQSQTDHAALLEINEKLPTSTQAKHVFHGWMYTSSPSISALEHPIYDITMVECVFANSTAKKKAEDAKKPAVPGKKSGATKP